MATAPLTQTTGRRKRSVARASLRPGTGQFSINGKALDVYFPTAASRMVVTEALTVTETTEPMTSAPASTAAASADKPAHCAWPLLGRFSNSTLRAAAR